ncbi:hypothetical protein RB595_004024 [Gaeumannomyces hyphopodioides]
MPSVRDGLKAFASALAAGWMTVGATAADVTPPNSASNPMRMWQTSAGTTYSDSFLIGNGRLGFSLPGSATSEVIVLNEDSFWSGNKMDRVNRNALSNLGRIRSMIVNNDLSGAHNVASANYAGTPNSMRNYDYPGRLSISMKGASGSVGGYERWLDLGEAVGGVYYTVGGVAFKREYLASFPDDIIAVQISASKSGAVSFDLRQTLASGQNSASAPGSDTIVMSGGNSISFTAGAKVVATGGTVRKSGDTITVDGADSAVIYWSAWTTFRKAKGDLQSAVLADLARASAKGYDAIRANHIKDYKALAGRAELSLGTSSGAQKSKPTADRLRGLANTFDPEISALYWYFARYLLIASARPGTLPANLQGIWNDSPSPAWGSKFTININLEMNYWPALVTNMPELHDSLFAHFKRMQENGRDVAKRMYNMSGAVCHHNTDLWGDCAPQDNDTGSTFWPSGLAWLAAHIFEHYDFTGDSEVLKAYYPVLRDVASFFLDFLTEYNGYLVTNPSVSPEQRYRAPNGGQVVAMSIAPTMDNCLLWELAGQMLEVEKVIGASDGGALSQRFMAARARLMPLRKDQYGGLAEWYRDFTETEPGHRHFSHMWGLFPGSRITSANRTSFDLARAAVRRRLSNGSGSTGWSRAWAVALLGRLFDGAGVADSYNYLLTRLTYPNSMLDVNPPSVFQLDGNYGGSAIVEALLQSHELVALPSSASTVVSDARSVKPAFVGDSNGGKNAHHLIRLLPTVPTKWASSGGGHFRGLLARGGFEVEASWGADAKLTRAVIRSVKGNTAWVMLGDVPIGDAAANSGTAQAIKVDGVGQGAVLKLQGEAGKKFTVTRA